MGGVVPFPDEILDELQKLAAEVSATAELEE
jgi:hypothetical protein